MPHDPARVAEARAWLARSASDLRAAAHDLAAVPPILDDAVFHCQQAEYAWKFRYPGELEEPTRGEAEAALVVARAVCDRLPSAVQT